MATEIKIIYQGGQGEIEEKKSRFIARVNPIASEEEALQFIEEIRKQYWDARHHCYAYVLGDQNQLQRMSDDKEPQGTAGKPILDVLLGEGIHNAVVVVTRYFGGTLLGTGGLVRAYQGAAKEGIKASLCLTKIAGAMFQVSFPYTYLGRFQYLLTEKKYGIKSCAYLEEVEMEVLVEEERIDQFTKMVVEETSGTVHPQKVCDCYFALVKEEYKLWEK